MKVAQKIKNLFFSQKNALLKSACIKLKNQNYEAAIKEFDKVISIVPHYEAYNNRGTAYYRLNQYQKAIQDYQEAITLNPCKEEAYMGLGIVYTKLREYPKAIQSYSQAIHYNPLHSVAYTNRGFALYQLQKYKEALVDFNQAISLHPFNAVAYSNRGAVHHQLGCEMAAKNDWKAAKELGMENIESTLLEQNHQP